MKYPLFLFFVLSIRPAYSMSCFSKHKKQPPKTTSPKRLDPSVIAKVAGDQSSPRPPSQTTIGRRNGREMSQARNLSTLYSLGNSSRKNKKIDDGK